MSEAHRIFTMVKNVFFLFFAFYACILLSARLQEWTERIRLNYPYPLLVQTEVGLMKLSGFHVPRSFPDFCSIAFIVTVAVMMCLVPSHGGFSQELWSDKWENMYSIVPKGYVCYRAESQITIDGRLDDPSWRNAPWTDYFVDIEGDVKPPPRFRTQAKMLWDDDYFYVAADMQEPHVW